MDLAKIQVKIQKDNSAVWVHFCYVPVEVKERFDKYVNTNNFYSNYWIAQWAYNEFNLMEIDTPEGMSALKEAIKNKYRERYPELYVESNTDKQGWLRVWYTENMERELREIGR